MKTIRRYLLALLGLLAIGAGGAPADPAPGSHDASFSQEGLFKADVLQLKDTQLVVSPDLPLVPDTNMLWCGTLQLAWNEAENLVGEKLHFTKPSAAADLLNQSDFTRADLDPSSYVAIADFERNHVEAEIRAVLERTFHGAASPELIPPVPRNPEPDDFVAYAYLYKNLAFAHPFVAGTMDFAGTPVKEFGFDSDADPKLRAQVSIRDYQSPDDFVIRLKTKESKDELILAKVTPSATLQATVQSVLARSTHHPAEIAGSADILSLPKLNFDLRRDFPELEGLVLQPGPHSKNQEQARYCQGRAARAVST